MTIIEEQMTPLDNHMTMLKYYLIPEYSACTLGKGNEYGHQPGPESRRDVAHAVAADNLGWRKKQTRFNSGYNDDGISLQRFVNEGSQLTVVFLVIQ